MDFSAGALARKLVTPSLEMVVGKNRAPHDGQVGVRPDKVVGKLFHKRQKAGECFALYFHRDMFSI